MTTVSGTQFNKALETPQMDGGKTFSNPFSVNVESYECPVASTDIIGLEKLDPRLASRIWRLNNLYTVINEAGVKVKFELRPAQQELLMNMSYKNIILKARQLGFTTFVCIFMLDYALFNSDKLLGIVAHTQTDATVIFHKIKVAWESFNPELKAFLTLQTTGDSKAEYEFSNGSRIRISTSLRSGTYQMVLVTEFGKVCAKYPEKAEEVITGTLPAVPAKGIVFIESTAEGEDGRYYEMVQEAIKLQQSGRPLTTKDYKFFFFPWYSNPADVLKADNLPIDNKMLSYFKDIERKCNVTLTQEQKNWYWMEQKTQRDKMKQEHPSTPDEAFLSSGNKLFKAELLDRHGQMWCETPIETIGNFNIYRKYVRSHMYGLGADVSMGIKEDSSTIVVIDFTTGEVVLTYQNNNIDPVAFAHEIKTAGTWYGICIAAPESNSVGLTTCVTLRDIYPNIYLQTRQGMLEDHQTQKLGWLTTPGTKPTMMYELSEAIENDDIKILDRAIITEARKFNREDSLQTSQSPTTTRHFDLLTACAIAWQMRIHATRGILNNEDSSRIENQRARTLSGRNRYQ